MNEESSAASRALYDHLGDPIPPHFGKRGRPAHVLPAENRQKVRLLLAFDWSNQRIARALRITGKTLRKHYFRELRQRDEARPALEAAMKELLRLIEHHDLARPQASAHRDQPEDEGETQ